MLTSSGSPPASEAAPHFGQFWGGNLARLLVAGHFCRPRASKDMPFGIFGADFRQIAVLGRQGNFHPHQGKKEVGVNQEEISPLVQEWITVVGQIDQIGRKLELTLDTQEKIRLEALRATKIHEAAMLLRTVDNLLLCIEEGDCESQGRRK